MRILPLILVFFSVYPTKTLTDDSSECIKEGESCGGFNPELCCSSSTCIFTDGSTMGTYPGETGNCVSSGRSGGKGCQSPGNPCGGSSGAECCSGAVCERKGKTFSCIGPTDTTEVRSDKSKDGLNCSELNGVCGGIPPIYCCGQLICSKQKSSWTDYESEKGICAKDSLQSTFFSRKKNSPSNKAPTKRPKVKAKNYNLIIPPVHH